jgi:AAA+ ATPase superfamily predicted ATPase
LRALALGKRKMAEILNETGLEKHVLSKYLAVLRELDLVERETPVTDQNPEKSKSGIYRIADPYMNFWFRFVFLNRSLLERGDTRTVLHEAKRDWNNYMGPVYEAIARQLFESWAATDQFSFRVTRIGRWWDKHQEIDLAAIDEQHQTLFCAEVKWTAKPVGTNIYDQLKVKAETLARQRAVRSAQLGLFSKCGFTEPLRKVAEKESVLLVKGDQVG